MKESFRRALIEGDMERSIYMFETGNVNIRCAFANIKGDFMFPVDCAAQSGNLELFKWLIESNHCPIATSSQCDRKQYLEPLLTSKGKDVLSIAMKYNYVPLVRYLVVNHCPIATSSQCDRKQYIESLLTLKGQGCLVDSNEVQLFNKISIHPLLLTMI